MNVADLVTRLLVVLPIFLLFMVVFNGVETLWIRISLSFSITYLLLYIVYVFVTKKRMSKKEAKQLDHILSELKKQK